MVYEICTLASVGKKKKLYFHKSFVTYKVQILIKLGIIIIFINWLICPLQHFFIGAIFTFFYLIASIVMAAHTCGQGGYAAAAVSITGEGVKWGWMGNICCCMKLMYTNQKVNLEFVLFYRFRCSGSSPP